MKGSIQTTERCPVCQSALIHDENKDGFVCKADPLNHPVITPRKCRVRFGRDVSRRFQNYREARQFLEGLRYKTIEGSFDKRDYKQDNPLGFTNQAERYLVMKARLKPEHCRRYVTPVINKAIKSWGQRNIKTIGFGDIEDFLLSFNVSNKSMYNYKSILHDMFVWVHEREGIPIPKMPKIKFELGWRNIISIEDQQRVIEEVRRISAHRTIRTWIGIKWLATYIAFRPKELISLKEHQINVNGFFVLPPPSTKEKEPKLIAMLPEDIELYESLPRGLPDMYFFRNEKPLGLTKPGDKFGQRHLYTWWKKACKNLGIEGVDLYGGTRHSTASALSEHFSEQEIMAAGTMHKTNTAARRYIQERKNQSIMVYSKIREMQKAPAEVISFGKKRGAK